MCHTCGIALVIFASAVCLTASAGATQAALAGPDFTAQAHGLATGYRYWFGRYLPADPQDSGHYAGMRPPACCIGAARPVIVVAKV
jgi:hypothetical protein